MGRVKEIVVKVIPGKVAAPFVKAHHYSGKIVQNSQLHFGCFLDGGLHGVMSFGPSMDKRKILPLVETDNKTDATASGDGTIYRAAGFKLTQIKENKTILVMPDGERITILNFTNGYHDKERICRKYGIPMWGGASVRPLLNMGAKYAEGFQLRYIKLLTPDCKLLVPEIPFTEIDKAGAGMWRGEKIPRAERHAKRQPEGRLDSSEEVKPIAISR